MENFLYCKKDLIYKEIFIGVFEFLDIIFK